MNNGQTNGDSGIRLQISGGAGPYEAAAIATVIEHSLAEERRIARSPARRFSNWKMVVLSEPFVPPRAGGNMALNGGGRSSAPRRSRKAEQ